MECSGQCTQHLNYFLPKCMYTKSILSALDITGKINSKLKIKTKEREENTDYKIFII